MTSYAAYLRTNTDDHQSPEDSAAWQLRLARQLIEPDGGEIVAIYHDIDQSRSILSERRPEASRILLDIWGGSPADNRDVTGIAFVLVENERLADDQVVVGRHLRMATLATLGNKETANASARQPEQDEAQDLATAPIAIASTNHLSSRARRPGGRPEA